MSSAADLATSTSTKQLHPSEVQLAAEEASGVDSATLNSTVNTASSTVTTPPVLLAPKPKELETLRGPVSPKISPRIPNRSNRSLGNSASSSPRRAVIGDESPSAMLERRGSGSGLISNLLAIDRGANAATLSPATSLNTTPTLLRRASKQGLGMIITKGTNSQLQTLLSSYLVKDIMNCQRAVIELPSTATPAEGFELLLKNNILSCPVFDVAKKEYIGFLDLRDLVSSVVFAAEEQHLLANSFSDRWNELLMKGMQRFGSTSAVTVTYLSRRNPFKPISSTSTLLQAAKALSTQLHRLPVVDESGKCCAIISQSSLIQFLHLHQDEMKSDFNQTIANLGLGICKVISVPSDASAWTAFKTLELNAVSGIAIVDREGKLVGNTSARDLKYFTLNKGSLSLDAPIQDYLSRIRQRDFVDEVHPSCSIGMQTTVQHTVGVLAATGYHRVFIVDTQGRPVGVVSVTDILRFASAESSATGPSSATSPNTPAATSSPSTPRSRLTVTAATSSPKAAHLRTLSQSSTPIVTPNP